MSWPAFLIACGATLTIWNPDPLWAWAYEIAIFLLAGVASVKARERPGPTGFILACIPLWGFGQLAFGASAYRWSTLNASLEVSALGATALMGLLALGHPSARDSFLNGLVWFGTALSVVSVLAYFTSTGKILWLVASPYPDNWGPFPSRNNFAQFLELCLPVALYRMPEVGVIPASVVLAAGLASASRAGAALLLLELFVGIYLLGNSLRRRILPLVLAGTVFAALAGAGVLWGRLKDPDPLQYRREIFRSATEMIATRPLNGFGLGTFATVYPEFAHFDSGTEVDHAHSDWLEWAAEGGLPFAILWLALMALIARPAIRSVWGLGVLAVFLHALVDDPFARFGVAAWQFLLIGAVLSES
jgi:O-antigen ligase